MSFDLTASAVEIDGLNPYQKLVLIIIAHHENRKTRLCAPSRKRISEMSGMSERQVQRSIQSLKQMGYIAQVNRRNKTSLYFFPKLIISDSKKSKNVDHMFYKNQESNRLPNKEELPTLKESNEID